MDDALEAANYAVEIADDIACHEAYLRWSEFHGTEKCRRCAGTGQFITYVENGVPKGPGGPCYRCNGKGVLTPADKRRNWGYDNFYMRVDY